MKIRYEFVTEIIEIEVSEEWGNIIAQCDRKEYNNNHAETRRHTGLSSDIESEWLSSEDFNPDRVLEEEAKRKRFDDAFSLLSPEQKRLIYAVFIEGMSHKEYAKSVGVSSSAISQQIATIKKILKKFYSEP